MKRNTLHELCSGASKIVSAVEHPRSLIGIFLGDNAMHLALALQWSIQGHILEQLMYQFKAGP